MRRTLIVSLGTTACGAVLHFKRRREGELRILRKRIRRASLEDLPVLEQLCVSLRESIRIMAIDLDATEAYRLPPPLEGKGASWDIGETVKVNLNPRHVVERFRTGQLPEVDQVNPETLRGLDAENASGGMRPNADLAFQVAAERIRSALRRNLIELLKSRHRLNSEQSVGIRVLLVAGTFGGTGSGAYDRVRLWLLQIGEEIGVHLDVCPLLMVPGAAEPKDPALSHANTCALLNEISADGTGYCWRLGHGSAGLRRIVFNPPFIVSDINNANGAPRIASESGFVALVGEILYVLAATPIGSHVDAQIGDFGVAGMNTTMLGEPRIARSIGYSTVFLDLERIELWSRSVIAQKFVEVACKPAPESAIRADVRAFLEGNALVFGDGRDDLPDWLLGQCAVREHLSLPRLRSLFSLATQELGDMQILREGRGRLQLALQQCGDFGPALERHANEFIARLAELLRDQVRTLLTDCRRGPAATSLWLAIGGGVVDAMLAAAGNELGQLQGEIAELDSRILKSEEEYQEELRARGAIYRALHAGYLSRAAAGFRADLEAWAIARVRSQSLSSGILVLNRLRQVLQRELLETAQPILASLAACAETLQEDRRRAAAHSLEFGCPNGLPLLATEGDLVELHSRSFSAADEADIVREFYTHLAKDADPALLLRDTGALNRFFEETATKTLLGARLGELNVVDELARRFADSANLGSVLRERDIEAYELLPLLGTSDQTSGVTLVRLAGVDGSRLEAIRPTLDTHQTARGVRYLPVDTGDRQRLSFVQVRAVFPVSDWRGYAMAHGHYEALRVSSDSERQHILPGFRFLPVLGRRVAQRDLVRLLVRAWILNRLDPTASRGWTVRPATDYEAPVAVDQGPAMAPQVAYRLAIDLLSSTNCLVMAVGPGALRERLAEFAAAMSNGSDVCGLKTLADQSMIAAAVGDLEAEADWWQRNTHPASFGWSGAKDTR